MPWATAPTKSSAVITACSSRRRRRGAAYQEFWRKLREGRHDAGQYLRIGKGGRQVWIEASYNPILDAEGRPFKVVKYATDITKRFTAAQTLRVTVQGLTENAERASQANTLAQDACKVAEEGGRTVQDVVRTMFAITDSSRRISEIIGVMDGIAFQTNILALNAAVEAAGPARTARVSPWSRPRCAAWRRTAPRRPRRSRG